MNKKLLAVPLAVAVTSAIAFSSPAQQVHTRFQGGGLVVRDGPVMRPPSMIINEVMFDPLGQDGSAINAEWVEIYTTEDVVLDGWRITDNLGATLGVLPDMDVPAHSAILVLFRGDLPFPYDGDPSDRSAAIALGLPLGDHLGNDFGGVRLVSPAGGVVDGVYWGRGAAPSGAQGAGWVTGSYYDLSFAGGSPLGEGDTLGRPVDPLASFTGTLADWDRNGGVNANAPTPGCRNGVEVADMTGLKMWAQTGVNEIINSFSATVEPGWFSITSSGIEGSTYDYQPNVYTVTSTHHFAVDFNGVPTTLSGPITASFARSEQEGAVSFTLSAQADLNSDAGYGFSFTHTEHHAGFHTDTGISDASTDVVYSQGGVDYPFSVSSAVTSTWIGEGQVLVQDDRVAQDYGGAGVKLSGATRTITKLADGAYASSFTLVRASPMGPPPLHKAGQQGALGSESFQVETSLVANGLGEIVSGVVPLLDHFVNGQLRTSLAAEQVGTFGFSLTSGLPGQYPQTSAYQLNLPMEQGGTPLPVTTTVTGASWIDQGKLLSSAVGSIDFAGTTVLVQQAFVDPVLGEGPQCQCCAQGCTDSQPPAEPPAAAPQPPAGDTPKSPGGFMGAAAVCAAAGAGIGAGVGAVTGGVAGGISGAVGGAGVGAIPGAVGGAVAGAKIGAAVGGLGGALTCGTMYLFELW